MLSLSCCATHYDLLQIYSSLTISLNFFTQLQASSSIFPPGSCNTLCFLALSEVGIILNAGSWNNDFWVVSGSGQKWVSYPSLSVLLKCSYSWLTPCLSILT